MEKQNNNPEPDPSQEFTDAIISGYEYIVEKGRDNRQRLYEAVDHGSLEKYLDIARLSELFSNETPINEQRAFINDILDNHFEEDDILPVGREVIIGKGSVYITKNSEGAESQWLLGGGDRIHGRVSGIRCMPIIDPMYLDSIAHYGADSTAYNQFGVALSLDFVFFERTGKFYESSPDFTFYIPLDYEGQNITKRVIFKK